MRRVALLFLIAIFAVAFSAPLIAPYSFATQFRDLPNAGAGRGHLLGTDDLGRDRLSRLLYGARVSLVLAPAAALLSIAIALVVALLAVLAGRSWESFAAAAANLVLSVPWIFLLMAARAMLPLNASAVSAILVTFGLLGVLGWAGPSRVLAAALRQYVQSDFVLFARASGCGRLRLGLVHLIPNLMPLAAAQLLITTPGFLLAEANLGLLGLGIPEPLPSWGSLLRDLENLSAVAANPWSLMPVLLLILVVASFHFVASNQELV